METNFVAVLTGHINIGENDAGAHFIEGFDGGLSIVHGDNFKFYVRKNLGDKPANRWAVIRQKNRSSHNSSWTYFLRPEIRPTDKSGRTLRSAPEKFQPGLPA